jgi:hypothetical protein
MRVISMQKYRDLTAVKSIILDYIIISTITFNKSIVCSSNCVVMYGAIESFSDILPAINGGASYEPVGVDMNCIRVACCILWCFT